jgi:pregnancy-associated plasma protein-A/type IX secretion system substrate protein
MKGRWTLVALLVIALCGIAAVAFASGEPDVGQGRVTDNTRHADNGEIVERCGTVEHGQAKQAPDFDTITRWIQENRIAAGGVIPVNFHVIYSNSVAGSNVPDSQLDAQIAVLNNNYAGKDYNGNPVSGARNTGYTFFKNSVTRTLASGSKKNWFTATPGGSAERNMKNALVVNPTGSLNFYTNKMGQNLLGWSTFPWNLSSNPNMDGVVIHYGSLPGGYLSPYNLGGTASHEIGHWVGLYHTFQGGCDGGNCSGAGDLVCDTPSEGTATSGCPSGKDTCPEAGLDPIHNYMDYSTDICYNNFTAGQDARADFMMATYRPLIGSARIANAGTIQNARGMGQTDFGLHAAPNPFNPRTKIEFSLTRESSVSLRVFDIHGHQVATVVNRTLPAGQHHFEFDGDRLASGVYAMVFRAEGREVVRRMTLLK